MKKQDILLAVATMVILAAPICQAQIYTVVNTNSSGLGSLPDAIVQANSGSFNEIVIQSGLGTISLNSQMILNANVTINGNGNTIDMQNSDRAFFVVGGTASFSNLTIQNGNATGGNGADGGGGGAGLGGAIFVGSGSYATANGAAVWTGLSAPVVTLTNLSFQNNTALGGAGSQINNNAGGAGGGGGMGGNGGAGYYTFLASHGGGGGGGFGQGAAGGASNPDNPVAGGAGAFSPVSGNLYYSGGAGGSDSGGDSGAAGGLNGGGGGGSNSSGGSNNTGGGGGGIGGGPGDSTSDEGTGGAGGFGGGGGGGDRVASGNVFGGAGGFGGGGGGLTDNNGVGGFGGGGGSPYTASNSTSGGFGGGNGGADYSDFYTFTGGGGGGMGAGGAVFAMNGASVNIVDSLFSNNLTAGGVAGDYGSGGSAVGADLFLGANVTITVSGTNSQTMTNLGGAGNPDDPNISDHASDPNAQGGVIKMGAGTLVLNGSQNFYSGATIVRQGTLMMGGGSSEVGTSSVTVGENDGDAANLIFGSGASLGLQGLDTQSDLPIMVGQSAGSSGTITIGTGAGSNGTSLGARQITGGPGNAAMVFNQQYDVSGTSSNYSFYTTLTGNLAVYQNGPGTTILDPQYGANTYAGGTFINAGVLAYSGADTLPVSGAVTINGGTLDNQGYDGTLSELNLQAGLVTGAGVLTAGAYTTQSGTIASVLAGSGSLVQSGSGTTVLSADNRYTGTTSIDGGTLIQLGNNQTSRYTVNSGGTLEIAGSGNSLSVAVVNTDGVLVVSGEENSLLISVAGGTLQVTGRGLGGEVAVTDGGELQFGADVDLRSLNWQKGSVISLSLGSNIDISTQFLVLEGGGTGANTFAFQVQPDVQVGESFTLVNFMTLFQLTVDDLAFTSDRAGFDGSFELSSNALSFTVNAIPEPSVGVLLAVGLAMVFVWKRRKKTNLM